MHWMHGGMLQFWNQSIVWLGTIWLYCLITQVWTHWNILISNSVSFKTQFYLYLSKRSSTSYLATKTLSIKIRMLSNSVVLKHHLKSSPSIAFMILIWNDIIFQACLYSLHVTKFTTKKKSLNLSGFKVLVVIFEE